MFGKDVEYFVLLQAALFERIGIVLVDFFLEAARNDSITESLDFSQRALAAHD